jgi:hypothetical protein
MLVNSLLITIKSLLITINGDYLSSFQWVVNRTGKSNSGSLNLPMLIHIKSYFESQLKNPINLHENILPSGYLTVRHGKSAHC